MRRVALLLSLLAVTSGVACREAPSTEYPLEGQVMAVDTERRLLTVRHEDIPGLMPGMTMSFPVATPDLLDGRERGELITATLEVTDSLGVLTSVTRTGFDALPDEDPVTAMATGLLDVGDLVPDTAFIDQHDQRRALSEWAGGFTLITFIYTRCPLPNFCPLMDQHFRTIQEAVAEDESLRGRVKLLSITFDPDFDTPAVLDAYAERREADPDVWTFLTGDRLTLSRFYTRFGIGAVPTEGAPDEITHNLRTALLGPDLRILHIYSGNTWTPGTVLGDLRDAVQQP